MRTKITIALTATLVVAAAAAPSAWADTQIRAGAGTRYTTPEVTMDQGERLTFLNQDFQSHDVVATQHDANHQPLFSTPLTGQNQENFVAGSEYLTTGSYDFVCSIHPNMTGKLNVTAAGTAKPRPGAGGTADTQPPTVALAIKTGTLRKARADRGLTVVLTLDEAATVTVRASSGGHSLGSRKASVSSGDTKLRIGLGAAARKQLRRGKTILIKVSAADAAGNKSSAKASRRLK